MSDDEGDDLPVTAGTVETETGNFRINRKKVGLTYSCPVDCDDNPITTHQEIIDFLKTKGACKFLVSKEQHQNGKTHWHAFVEYDKKLNTTDTRYFDLLGVHPNIIKPARGHGWEAYVAKKGDWQSDYYENSPWTVAMKLNKLEECVSHLFQKVPRDTVLNMAKIEYAYSKLKPKPVKERPLMEFTIPFFTDFDRAILLEGKSGWGKTQFALRCFKNPKIVRQVEDLRSLDATHDGIVFDDMAFTHWPRQSQIHLVDMDEESSISARYNNVTIPAGMPRIFTFNPDHMPVDRTDDAIHRRTRHVILDADIRRL